MSFIDKVLKEPSYGWSDGDGHLIKPTTKQLFTEFRKRINITKDKKNWISAICVIMISCLLPFFLLFVFNYASFPLVLFSIFYAMIVMGVHGTIWYHRYCTHKSYTFSNSFWRILTQNLVIKTFPEEVYVISHHVHHVKSDLPGDPYNARGGFLYCMLSDVNHQAINQDLTEGEYRKAANWMKHSGVEINSYEEYSKWGAVTTLRYSLLSWFVNWSIWFTIFYLIGGVGLALAAFTGAMFWYLLVPAFNYTGHGKGEEVHKEGLDYDRTNLSINQARPGYFAGEWHNNHHLYPKSARAGFLPNQLDLAWVYIFLMFKLGAVSKFIDNKQDFLKKYVMT